MFQLNDTSAGHVHFMTRGAGGLCCSTCSPFSMILLLVHGGSSSVLSHNYSLGIPFHLVLSVKYNTDLWSTVAQLEMR